ncbi:MAG: hypothetical protein U0556_04300 [Dehalococcoidia bacterium]
MTGVDGPKYLLLFDHRGSFKEEMRDWNDPLTPEQTAPIAAEKR